MGQTARAASVLIHDAKPSAVAKSLSWDEAFTDRSGNLPVHFVARYEDTQGQPHRLEEWRVGRKHLRRLTDNRIDLHADATGNAGSSFPGNYLWQIVDVQQKIDHRVSGQGLLRLGMLYNYYAMSHGLSRPAGDFQVRRVRELAPVAWHGFRGEWFQVSATGQPSTRVCWSSALGIPLRLMKQANGQWEMNFELSEVETRPFAPTVFTVPTAGLQIRDVDDTGLED